MAGKDPDEAFRNFRDPLMEALGCITPGRLTLLHFHRYEEGKEYAIALNDNDPVRLDAPFPLFFTAGQQFQIVRSDDPDLGPFKVHTVAYWYQFQADRRRPGSDVLAFHWTPEAANADNRRYPHMHIGSAMVANDAPVLPKRFNKLHIPTSRVSFESVVRFAIEELGVVPLRADYDAVLARTESVFRLRKTR